MLFNPKPGAPPLPFPTALPGFGASVAQPISGQHATNPTKLRHFSLRSRRGHVKRPPFPYWHSISEPYYGNGHPIPIEQDRANQRWLSHYWKQNLSSTDQAAWTAFAAAHPMQNYYGKTLSLSGWGCFIRCNRFAITDFSPPVRWPVDGDPPRWPTPPPDWPTLATMTPTAWALKIRQPAPPSRLTVYWYINFTISWPSTPSDLAILLYLSNPGKIISARKQGPLFYACGTYTTGLPNRHLSLLSNLYHPLLQVGQTITLAYRFYRSTNGGESPLTWLNLVAIPY